MVPSRSERFRCAAVALVAIALFNASSAAAEPSASERETARTLLFSGRDKRKSGQLKEALADFEKAHAIMGVPTTGLDLGRTQKDLGMFVEARATLLEAARFPEKAGEPLPFKRARKEAKQLADEIAPHLATLTISVPSGAKVTMDDAELSPTSLGVPLKVNPGKHEIVASTSSDEKRSSVDLHEGEQKTVELHVNDEAPAPPPVARDTRAPEKPERRTSSLVYVGAVVAGVGALAGSITGVMAFSVKSDVSSRCPDNQCPPSTYADIDRGETYGTISTVSFAVAGVGAVLLVYGLLNPTTTTPTQGKASWIATPLGVTGAF